MLFFLLKIKITKTDLLDFPLVSEMIERGFIPQVKSLFPLTVEPTADTQIIDYLVSAIK